MKLRNKKTGKIAEAIDLVNDDEIWGTVKTPSEIFEDWEYYKPVKPLIKDEKIRKAVRAWAEANNRDTFLVINEHFNCCKIIGYTDGRNASCDKIEFGTTIAGANKDYHYTIVELYGEEEE